jgi:predicted XRE-type DNA-binding protein
MQAEAPLRRRARRLSEADAAVIKLLLSIGLPQYRIAALFDVDQSRVSEIKTGKRFSNA